MKKGLPFLVTGIIIIAVAIFGFTNAERGIRAGSFLVESTTKTVGLATPKDNQPSVIEQWAGGMAGCVQNLEVEVDYAGLYIKMGTAVAERLTKNMVEEKLEDFGIKVDKLDDDYEVLGLVVYRYAASNDAGYRVEVSYAIDMCGMTITKE